MQQQNKKNKFKKWLKRTLFIVFILLMLMLLHHYQVAFDALAKLNVEQSTDIHNMQKELHSIQLQDLQIKHQLDGLQLKINGQYQDIHNDMPQPDLHKDSKVHNVSAFTPTSIITTTTVTILTLVKGITSLIPAFN